MESTEIFKKVRKIEIKTRGLSNHIFSGQYHSAFKGRGMTFSEVREYEYGDDIRNIDWNVTARFNKPFVKIFEEEREMTVMLLIDVSGSNDFGSQSQSKRDLTAELAAVLAFSAIQNNDKVGVIFFSSKIEKFIPPKKDGTRHRHWRGLAFPDLGHQAPHHGLPHLRLHDGQELREGDADCRQQARPRRLAYHRPP